MYSDDLLGCVNSDEHFYVLNRTNLIRRINQESHKIYFVFPPYLAKIWTSWNDRWQVTFFSCYFFIILRCCKQFNPSRETCFNTLSHVSFYAFGTRIKCFINAAPRSDESLLPPRFVAWTAVQIRTILWWKNQSLCSFSEVVAGCFRLAGLSFMVFCRQEIQKKQVYLSANTMLKHLCSNSLFVFTLGQLGENTIHQKWSVQISLNFWNELTLHANSVMGSHVHNMCSLQCDVPVLHQMPKKQSAQDR